MPRRKIQSVAVTQQNKNQAMRLKKQYDEEKGLLTIWLKINQQEKEGGKQIRQLRGSISNEGVQQKMKNQFFSCKNIIHAIDNNSYTVDLQKNIIVVKNTLLVNQTESIQRIIEINLEQLQSESIKIDEEEFENIIRLRQQNKAKDEQIQQLNHRLYDFKELMKKQYGSVIRSIENLKKQIDNLKRDGFSQVINAELKGNTEKKSDIEQKPGRKPGRKPGKKPGTASDCKIINIPLVKTKKINKVRSNSGYKDEQDQQAVQSQSVQQSVINDSQSMVDENKSSSLDEISQSNMEVDEPSKKHQNQQKQVGKSETNRNQVIACRLPFQIKQKFVFDKKISKQQESISKIKIEHCADDNVKLGLMNENESNIFSYVSNGNIYQRGKCITKIEPFLSGDIILFKVKPRENCIQVHVNGKNKFSGKFRSQQLINYDKILWYTCFQEVGASVIVLRNDVTQ